MTIWYAWHIICSFQSLSYNTTPSILKFLIWAPLKNRPKHRATIKGNTVFQIQSKHTKRHVPQSSFILRYFTTDNIPRCSNKVSYAFVHKNNNKRVFSNYYRHTTVSSILQARHRYSQMCFQVNNINSIHGIYLVF